MPVIYLAFCVGFAFSNWNESSLKSECSKNYLICVNDTIPLRNADSLDQEMFIEEIRDTTGKTFSDDLSSILHVLKYYKISVPEFKYAYFKKVYIGPGGYYDDLQLYNDKMILFRADFNRNITPLFVTYYKLQNNKVDSNNYQFINGKLEKTD